MKKGRVHCLACKESLAVGQEDCQAICGDCGGTERSLDPVTLKLRHCDACGSSAVATRWPACPSCLEKELERFVLDKSDDVDWWPSSAPCRLAASRLAEASAEWARLAHLLEPMTPGPPESSCSCQLGEGGYGFAGHHHVVTTRIFWELKIWREEYYDEKAPRGGPKMSDVIRHETIIDPDDGEVLELPITVAMDLERRATALAGSVILTGPNLGKCPHYYAAIAKNCAESKAAKAADKHEKKGSREASW